MKSIKISLAVVALLAGVVGASANKLFTPQTFQFTGSDPLNRAHYTQVDMLPGDCQIPLQKVCYIVAEADVDGKPVITSSLQSEINDALGISDGTKNNTTNVQLKRN